MNPEPQLFSIAMVGGNFNSSYYTFVPIVCFYLVQKCNDLLSFSNIQ